MKVIERLLERRFAVVPRLVRAGGECLVAQGLVAARGLRADDVSRALSGNVDLHRVSTRPNGKEEGEDHAEF